jgi:hypothetical protein
MSAPVSNFEDLKRAKTLVKQRLRRSLSRFADLSDKAVLAAPFALADALEVVAREEGFSSWVSASQESKNMPNPQLSKEKDDVSHLVAAYPQARVANVTCAAEFYREKLGFRRLPVWRDAVLRPGRARVDCSPG